MFTTPDSPALSRKSDLSAVKFAAAVRANEEFRRAEFPSLFHRAADAYIVNGRHGKTIVAGYPWFTDSGRDTFIALRGLCLATGRLADARDILLAWANSVSEGMLPNLFPDHGAKPEYNSVDASLWYVIAVHELFIACNGNGGIVSAKDRRTFQDAILAILDGYSKGTRFGIRMDSDGLLAAGERGLQLTWMDAKVGEWVVTPRAGKPVEIQALWLNALKIAAQFSPGWQEAFERGMKSFRDKFWNEQRGCLFEVIDVNHRAGEVDAAFRPTPLGLRSLAPDEPNYKPHYEGGVTQRDGSYHQGTVWPWLIGPFVEAWVRVHGNNTAVKREAREKFLAPVLGHLEEAGLGHISEIADAEQPHTPRGCPFQAWSVGEALRLDQVVLAEREEARTSVRFTAPKMGTSRIPIAAQPKKIGALPRPRATRQRDAVTV
jgi:glycogen debranching enzyme